MSRCHPCHPTAGAGRARGQTWPPSPSLSPHSLPLAPATRRKTHRQQSALESPRLCQELCVGEGKAEPFPVGPWKVLAGSTCPAPQLLQPCPLLLAAPERVPGALKLLPVPACPHSGQCSRCQLGQSRFLSLGAQTQLPPHIAGSITAAVAGVGVGSPKHKARAGDSRAPPGPATPISASWAQGKTQPTGQPPEQGRGFWMLHFIPATADTNSVPLLLPAPRAELWNGETRAARDEPTRCPAVTHPAREGQAGP